MKAMILAAGKGTRMQPITLSTPKPMIPLVNKPIMQVIVEHMRSYGVNDIVVNTSYLADKIKDYFRDGNALGVNIAYSFEGYIEAGEIHGQALGSAGGMKNIQQTSGFFDSTFLVVCGDAYIDFDIEKLYQFHKHNSSVATILMKEVPLEEVSKYGVVVTADNGKIKQFQEKPAIEDALSTMINTGIYMFEPEVLDLIPPNQEYDIGGELFPTLVENNANFFAQCQDFQWVDIGSLPDIFTSQTMALNGEISGFKVPGNEVAPGTFTGIHCSVDVANCNITGPVYIGSGTTIESGATIVGPSIIGSNCIVESGAVVNGTFIDDFKRVKSAAVIENLIVHDKYAVDQNGAVHDLKLLKCEWMLDDVRNRDTVGDYEKLLAEQSKETNAA